MAKLIIEVLDACDLLSTDSHGLASPFVEVDFDGRCLLLISESEASVQRYPLCKRGFFPHGRGDISLKIYTVRAQYYGNQQLLYLNFKNNETRDRYSCGTSGIAAEANDAFPELWNSDSNAQHASPLYQDRPPEIRVKLHLENQTKLTSTPKVIDGNPSWNEEILLIASEPLDEILTISIVNRGTPSKEELMGRTVLPLSGIPSLQLGILRAHNLPPLKKHTDGVTTTDAYCVVKYGNKWIRTKTLINSQEPIWNEEYTWDVCDPCTVIRIGVIDNRNVTVSNKETKDMRIGKVFIPIQTLHVNRMHTQYYPLLVLSPSGLKNHGEIQVAVRFTVISWANVVLLYTKPLLPKMNYLQPVDKVQLDVDRFRAMKIVAACLSKANPPIKNEIVEYLLDDEYSIWNLMLEIGLRPTNPPLLDARLSHAETIDPEDPSEEFDTFPTSQPIGTVKRRYDRLRSIAGRYQTMAADIATVSEKLKAILICKDLRATLIFTLIAFICVVFIYMASFKVVATLFGFYLFRPPRFRSKQTRLLLNLFSKLPSNMDVMIL
ncbi:FT-interacting protein 7-like [Rutidosis leptorrhynchoides]|uniref:FT-interacting protein 7-like n=1 Tax=Rutidosis leptorrhynchoides TaxID=125765 RepID=UPI003A99176A